MCRMINLQNTAMARVVLIILSLISMAPAAAVDKFISNKEEGWFWYQREPEPPPPSEPVKPPLSTPAKKAPEPVKQAPAKPSALSVEWFQQEYRKILSDAVDDPSPENMRKYRYSTRVMLDKASNFTHAFQRESLLDPLLDEANRMPFSSAARGSFMRLTTEEQTKATESIGKKAGLWVFLDETCAFCALQYPIVARTIRERGLTAIYITPDGARPSWMAKTDDVRKEAGQSKYLRIGVRPAVALIVPPENIIVLTQGMIAQDMLEERILFAGDQAGLLTAEISKKAFPERRGLLTTQDIQEIGSSIQDDPSTLTRSVQERLQKRY